MEKELSETETNLKLEQLRELTEMCGTLEELQIRQLKYWPRLILEAVTGCETHFSYHTRELTYEIEIDEKSKARIDTAKKMLPDLEMWSQFLLGDKYLVKVRFNGKTVFRGTRKSQFDPQASEKELEAEFTNYVSKEYKRTKKFAK